VQAAADDAGAPRTPATLDAMTRPMTASSRDTPCRRRDRVARSVEEVTADALPGGDG
jgi:hypothetical protein